MDPRSRLLLLVTLTTAMAAVVAVTIALPEPTPFQSLSLRLLLAMMAGLAAFIFYFYIEFLRLPPSVRAPMLAVGILTVFVLVYFVNPIYLITRGERTDLRVYLEAAEQSLIQQDPGTAELLYSRALESYRESQ